jgi:hypothetical protein
VSSAEGSPERVEGITGRVTRGRYAVGSKSERDALWLETPTGKLLLRRKDGPSFGDRSLDRYVGKEVKADGVRVGDLFLAERVTLI